MLNAEEETHIEQLHDLVTDMLCFKHPIVFDDNIQVDVCKLAKEGQLKKQNKNKTKQNKQTNKQKQKQKPQSKKTTRSLWNSSKQTHQM